MSKRTIVAMRGQPRTYNYIKQSTRALLDRVYGDYDFYWVTRPSSTVTHEQMLEDWQGHSPKIIYADAYRDPHNNSQRDQSYLDWALSQHIAWDDVEQMVLIRPDVYYQPSDQADKIDGIDKMMISGWWINNNTSQSVSDFYCQAGADAARLLLRRHEAEWRALADWMVLQGFTTKYSLRYAGEFKPEHRPNYASWTCRVVRPTQIPFVTPKWNGVANYDAEWDGMKRRERQALCLALNIAPEDYSVGEKFYKKKFPVYEYDSVESFRHRSIYYLKNRDKT